MKMKALLTLLMLPGTAAIAQFKTSKHVVAAGGSIRPGETYTSVIVAGQTATGRFSTSVFKGSIGYLEASDALPVLTVAYNELSPVAVVFPNPNLGRFALRLRALTAGAVLWRLTDLPGKLYRQGAFQATVGDNEVSFEGVPDGVWLLCITGTQQKQVVIKVIVRN